MPPMTSFDSDVALTLATCDTDGDDVCNDHASLNQSTPFILPTQIQCVWRVRWRQTTHCPMLITCNTCIQVMSLFSIDCEHDWCDLMSYSPSIKSVVSLVIMCIIASRTLRRWWLVVDAAVVVIIDVVDVVLNWSLENSSTACQSNNIKFQTKTTHKQQYLINTIVKWRQLQSHNDHWRIERKQKHQST